MLSYYYSNNNDDDDDDDEDDNNINKSDIVKRVNYFLLNDKFSNFKNPILGYLILASLSNEFHSLNWPCGWDIKNINNTLKELYNYLFELYTK